VTCGDYVLIDETRWYWCAPHRTEIPQSCVAQRCSIREPESRFTSSRRTVSCDRESPAHSVRISPQCLSGRELSAETTGTLGVIRRGRAEIFGSSVESIDVAAQQIFYVALTKIAVAIPRGAELIISSYGASPNHCGSNMLLEPTACVGERK
jgi:hypothetical protein